MSPTQSLSDLLRAIEEETLHGDITTALLLCQKLGGHLGSDLLRSWAVNELTGWPPEEPVPDYRTLEGAPVGHGSVLAQSVKTPIPADWFSPELLDAGALTASVRTSISEVQQISKREDVSLMPPSAALLAKYVTEKK